MNMKKSFLAVALLAGMSSSAFAGPLTLNGTSLNIGDIDFNQIDLSSEVASATQTDDGDGFVTGNDTFIEFGSTYATELKLGASQTYGGSLQGNNVFGNLLAASINTVLFFDYTAQGSASLIGPNTLSLAFTSVTASLYALFNNDNSTATNSLGIAGFANHGFDEKVDLIDFSLASGGCTLNVEVVGGLVRPVGNGNSCKLNFVADDFHGMFSHLGQSADLLDPVNLSIVYEATIQDFVGLDFAYVGSQDFEILHDANINFAVPAPGSLAILGLSLFGLAGLSRTRKAS